ncbi:MAG: multicopper oxidase family protein, partial [Methylocystaceae bacterium]|nr:multicopper oxidase family protein [Methylocystaceae bacterium]
MLSRRTFLMTSGALAVSPISLSSAQTTPQTILKLKRRVIDVNGKAASVYGIQQPDGRYGMTTDV